ncbi:tRNA synthetases class I-domain-containing protein [Salix suchowensis]|nr:tRNA synthetases class I-domain-containing protein [Salix suchowensis]
MSILYRYLALRRPPALRLIARMSQESASTPNDVSVTPAGEATPITKSAAKKEAKRLEKEAKLAAKKKAKAEKEKKVEEAPFVNTTPKGEKKGYNPIAVEAAWYDWWNAQGFFAPQMTSEGKPKPAGSFVIPAPPPNVTGSLHIGHALTVAIQDSLIRWNRMLGKTTLFVPGFDHKRLYKSSGKTRRDLGREAFLETVIYQARITNQLHRLGGSYDWQRKLSKAVIENFCRLHEDGIIYRANRLVNWCVRLNTTLSNLEVDQKQLTGRTMLNVPGYDAKERFEFGVITSFAYPLEDSVDEKIIVATTRPETMLGDTAIAVHPDDPRYKHLHGKFAKHPFVDRRIPIVADSIIVDMEFGTGAVKITPAHDPNDYEVGTRHKLPFINILNDDGTFNENAGEKFRVTGLYIETKDNPMQIPLCSKSGDIIEPLLKPQWWVSCKPLADEAIKVSRFSPESISAASEADWYRWLEGIQDWCISRQLWWGHRCPAYFVRIEGKDQDRIDGANWVVGRTLEEATERAKVVANGAPFTLEQDEDVLDTWFSSGLWPFSIMAGQTRYTPDLQNFYPSSLLETGWDILFFWVARMVLLEVYCHAMIRDAHGRKMSKSLGNVIDPLDVIQGLPLEALHEKLSEGNLDEKEIQKAKLGQKKDFPKGIPQCGTDALRFALCAYSGGGRDINLEILRVEGYRKFCNKIFNATKFAMLRLDETFVPEALPKKWIFHKLNIAAAEINKQLADRNFMNATTAAYNFWLYELCDVYIEAMKPMTDEAASTAVRRSAQQTLYTCLDYGLRLLHPFMPFVTEELWQRLPRRSNDSTPSIMVSSFPVHVGKADKQFDLIFSALKTGRSLAASYNLQSEIQFFFHAQTDEEAKLLESQMPTIIPPGCGGSIVTATVAVHTLVRGLVDLDVEISKCDKKLDLAKLSLQKIVKVESQADYEDTVPANVRLVNEEKRKTLKAEITTLEASKSMFLQLK